MRIFARVRHMHNDAMAALNQANGSLAQAQAARQVAVATAGRLRCAGHENHFREAVELQLRGTRKS